MFNPYKRTADYFKDEDELDDRAELQAAINRERVLQFASTDYYREFLSWLDAESFKPLNTTSDRDVLVSAVRANTLREIRSHLERVVASARAAAEGDK